jgi:CMP-N-acetylneuraminic acid synthetase
MINKKKVLAIIPARSGSQRLKNKNITLFFKKPLIYWTIKSAINSRIIDEVVVTSDSKKILNLSKRYGVNYLIKRSLKLSDSKADSWDVVRNTVLKLKKKIEFDYIVLLQITSPLRTAFDIDKCLKIFSNSKVTGIVSANNIRELSNWIFKLRNKNFYKYFKSRLKKNIIKNRFNNNLINGAIYAFKKNEIFRKNFFYKKSVKIFKMKPQLSIDIDDKLDLYVAKKIILNSKNKNIFKY